MPQTLRVAVASQQHYGVSMTRGLNKPEIPPTPHDKLPADVLAEIAPFDAALAADPKDQAALVERSHHVRKPQTHRQRAGDVLQAARAVAGRGLDQGQNFRSGRKRSPHQAAAATAAAAAGGKTYALLVGISKYAKPELALQFADADASVFGQLLESPRGGGLPPDNVLLLTDEKATTAAVRNGFQDFLKRRAGKNDTVVILIAGHGTVEVPGSRDAFILTYDSDPQDLKSTALPMAELQSLFEEQLAKVGRVLLFVDVCKAGTIGTIHNTTVSSNVQQLGDANGDLFGLLASRPKEVSLEGPQFGGGHGVFSYYVIKGLEGAADENKDGTVDANELIKYVTDQVQTATNDKQHPREFGTYDNTMRLSDVRKPGINIAHWQMIFDSRSGRASLSGVDRVRRRRCFDDQASDDVDRFTSAITAGRILPTDPNNAFAALRSLQAQLTPEQYQERKNQLQVALENKAQEVLLRYLAGDERPQAQAAFEQGARYMEAARTLTAGIAVPGRARGFLPGPRAAVRQEISRGGAVARTVRAHRSWRGLRIQRAGHRVPGAGAVRQSDPGVSRRRATRAALVLSAAQRSAGLRRDGRLQVGDPRLSGSHAADTAVQLFAVQPRPGLPAAEPAQRRRGVVSEGQRTGAGCRPSRTTRWER